MIHDLMFISAISSLHIGAGEGLGTIDRPVMRERTTGYPVIPGSTLKGVLRDEYRVQINTRDYVDALFGPMDDGSKYAGCISFSDAALFAFPIRSLKGTFVWATTPLILHRINRIFEISGQKDSFPKFKALVAKSELHSDMRKVFINPSSRSALLISNTKTPVESKIILEEFAFSTESLPELKDFASEIGKCIFGSGTIFEQEFVKKLVVLPGDMFSHFATYATEVVPNIKIEDATGTSKEGLRYSEYLPAETILYGMVSFDKSLIDNGPKVLDRNILGDASQIKNLIISNKPKNAIQIGADATKGKGLVNMNFV